MADVIERVTRSGGLYPWDEWVSGCLKTGRGFSAKRGRDFKVKPASFRSAVYMTALRRGLKAEVAVKGGVVEFSFYRDEPPAKRSVKR